MDEGSIFALAFQRETQSISDMFDRCVHLSLLVVADGVVVRWRWCPILDLVVAAAGRGGGVCRGGGDVLI